MKTPACWPEIWCLLTKQETRLAMHQSPSQTAKTSQKQEEGLQWLPRCWQKWSWRKKSRLGMGSDGQPHGPASRAGDRSWASSTLGCAARGLQAPQRRRLRRRWAPTAWEVSSGATAGLSGTLFPVFSLMMFTRWSWASGSQRCPPLSLRHQDARDWWGCVCTRSHTPCRARAVTHQ